MRLWFLCLILACLDALLAWGCTTSAPIAAVKLPAPQPVPIYEQLDPTFSMTDIEDWGAEAQMRFGPNIVIVGCHGWYSVHGVWLVEPVLLNPIEAIDRPWAVGDLIHYEQAAHPGRVLVLLCCNVDGVVLRGYPDVWYSPHENWCTPDAFCSTNGNIMRHLTQPSVVGDIKDFVSAK